MQTRIVETPRPRPPAKVRRSLAKGSSTPPPAYASTFPFPATGTEDDGMMSPISGAYSSDGWSTANSSGFTTSAAPPPTDDLSWLNDKSRDELTDLLVKADVLIKERESELNLTSAACKTLYESNVALKTKHETLLSRLPSHPTPNTNYTAISPPSHSPLLPRSPLPPLTAHKSMSESIFSSSTPPERIPSQSYNYLPHQHHGASPAEISFLADQNTELLLKLEKLEAEASSADVVGRRELRRLEKDISVLKEELEKTQARSDEIEEKAKNGFGLGAERVIERVWKKKKERQAKIDAIKKATREDNESATFRNFAPEAPFGTSTSQLLSELDLSSNEEDGFSVAVDELTVIQDTSTVPQDQQLIVKLLEKIQELEATNTRILEQQMETSSRLQIVQRETEFMTKVYERLSDPNSNDVPADLSEYATDQAPGDLNSKLKQSGLVLQSQLLATKVKRQRSFHRRASRMRVHSSITHLSGDVAENMGSLTPNKANQLPIPFSDTPSNSTFHRSSQSIGSAGYISPALSSLSLNSPSTVLMEELSPSGPVGRSLANELGYSWSSSSGTSNLETSSPDTGYKTVPSSPSQVAQIQTIANLGYHNRSDSLPTPQSILTNTLELSIEPPTPLKGLQIPKHDSVLIGNMSPRFRDTFRSRNVRWSDSRQLEREVVGRRMFVGDASPTPSKVSPGGRLLVGAFEVMMDEFDVRGGFDKTTANVSRSPSPEICEQLDKSKEDGLESYSEENSLTLPSEKQVVQSRFGALMVELWMWLQFVIIMLVFVWAMARRGPKLVLRDAERKRTLSLKRRA